MDVDISLSPGDTIRRRVLHEQYGGRRQGGISPSRVSNNVFIFTDPVKGIAHGYVYDGWRDDGLFHYTGEGQIGDQLMAQGNRAIRDHEAEGRELHVFEVTNGVATYLDEFEYVDHYWADGADTNGDPRSLLVYRLRPKHIAAGVNRSKVDRLGREPVKEVPVEQHLTESTIVGPADSPHEAARREQKLVVSFLEFLVSRGHDVCRLQLLPPDEPAPIFCDLYDKTDNVVVEAKGSVARPAIRMAVGQLADYSRLLTPSPRKVLLVPQEPRPDLLDLSASQDIEVAWPNGSSFVTTGEWME